MKKRKPLSVVLSHVTFSIVIIIIMYFRIYIIRKSLYIFTRLYMSFVF